MFLAVPLGAMACYSTVPQLIPVLTTYPLPLGYMGDILGGGFAETVRSSAEQPVRPVHLLAAAAPLLVILYETGPIPVETPSGTNELGLIEEARPFEHSGRCFAMLRWGSAMKQLILFTILLNVFIAPGGLARRPASARSRCCWAKVWCWCGDRG